MIHCMELYLQCAKLRRHLKQQQKYNETNKIFKATHNMHGDNYKHTYTDRQTDKRDGRITSA